MRIICPKCKQNVIAEQVGDTTIFRGVRSNGAVVDTAGVRQFECGLCGYSWKPERKKEIETDGNDDGKEDRTDPQTAAVR